MVQGRGGSPIIVALDFHAQAEAEALIERLEPAMCRLKVGKEMFTLLGPDWVRSLCRRGFDVFLDLKFHDIPNTTAQAVCAAADLGVWMVNVHASGGARMMAECRERLSVYGADRPLLIGVTVLTSMEAQDLADVGVNDEPRVQVMRLASLAQRCGLDGVVCSAQESSMLRTSLGGDFALVTPGIRPSSAQADDQRRVMTPAEAMQAGSDYLVIGRPVTRADDPVEVLKRIRSELALPA